MKIKNKVFWVTRTAVMIALLVVLQAVTTPLGSTLLTGSLVNLLLVISVMTSGLGCGLSVALFSPLAAKLLGIGPLWGLIPFIAAGNLGLVLVWHFIGNRKNVPALRAYGLALVSAAVTKFLILYIGIVQFALPLILKLPAPQANAISGLFSFPQLATALAGGIAAAFLLPALNKALRSKNV